ncbi:diaminopimelate decarboxylase [Streptomyces benahoarensis]|uniref:Diaminopimelate decarboxylase n=1 Tax=Streptomyces benahoarensis TaxID=2595054 RepID=A0A553ZP36_9ACTN|nr:diaminopimelate decarboxylase [Streptomyces benahoarensis]TSB15278.1 diaminopimelate decarboxylase [Streptomyces benahoarensis]TSB43227.1 diaminopimelate decarboxylase [Streptomyces benahoarensis]
MTGLTTGSPTVPGPTDRDRAVRAAVERGLVSPATPVAGLLDVAGVRRSAAELRSTFAEFTEAGVPVLHAFAVKAASLVPVLRLLADEGLGCEVASPGELALARAAHVPARRTVLDSPAKTPAELREALALGIAVNIDNPEELARVDALVASAPTGAPLGLRVNPQLGGGSIGAMSTATDTSKFGVALRDEGARAWVVRAYLDRPWLTRLHGHVGSQGMALPLMADGVRALFDLAEEINAQAGRAQVDTLDIGGGLPVNFASDRVTPTYREYVEVLRERVPGLFRGRYGLVTEFGRSLLAKHGTVVARVEYAKSAGGRPIAVTHAGAQVATRTVFVPDAWPLRVAAYDARGLPKEGPPVAQDVAGPCCFAGDLVAENRPLPLLESGDHAALLDTGAYYFSTHFAYNSLPRPGVYGYTADPSGEVRFATVRTPQTLEELTAESGGAHGEELRTLR